MIFLRMLLWYGFATPCCLTGTPAITFDDEFINELESEMRQRMFNLCLRILEFPTADLVLRFHDEVSVIGKNFREFLRGFDVKVYDSRVPAFRCV